MNPWYQYERHRNEEPISLSPDGNLLSVYSYSAITDLINRKELKCDFTFRSTRMIFGKNILDIDGLDHTRIKNIIKPVLTNATSKDSLVSFIKNVIFETFDDCLKKNEFEFRSEFAEIVPVKIICKFLGIPQQHVVEVAKCLKPIIAYIDSPENSLTIARNQKKEIDKLVLILLNSGERQDFLEYFYKKHTDGEISYAEFLSNFSLLLAAGTATTTGSMINLLYLMINNSNAILSNNNGYSIHSIVRESLRLRPPLHSTVRFVIEDFEYNDIKFVKGMAVEFNFASANRDKKVYTQPAEWNAGRPEKKIYSFGGGEHACLGINLALQELYFTSEKIITSLAHLEIVDFCDAVHGLHSFHAPSILKIRKIPS